MDRGNLKASGASMLAGAMVLNEAVCVCARATGDALSWLQFGIGWLVFVDGLISYNVDFNVDIEGSGASKEFVAYVPGFLASLSLLMCALPFSVRPLDSIADRSMSATAAGSTSSALMT